MLQRISLTLVLAGAALAGPVAQAHHGTSITYFVDKSISMSGVVTLFAWKAGEFRM